MLSQPSLMAIIETLWQARSQKKSSKSRRWSAVSTIPFVRKYIKNLALRPSVPQKWGHGSFLRPLKRNKRDYLSKQRQVMYIIIGGGGDVGYYLTKSLLNQGHEVLLLEKGQARFQALNEELGQ